MSECNVKWPHAEICLDISTSSKLIEKEPQVLTHLIGKFPQMSHDWRLAPHPYTNSCTAIKNMLPSIDHLATNRGKKVQPINVVWHRHAHILTGSGTITISTRSLPLISESSQNRQLRTCYSLLVYQFTSVQGVGKSSTLLRYTSQNTLEKNGGVNTLFNK